MLEVSLIISIFEHFSQIEKISIYVDRDILRLLESQYRNEIVVYVSTKDGLTFFVGKFKKDVFKKNYLIILENSLFVNNNRFFEDLFTVPSIYKEKESYQRYDYQKYLNII